MSMTAWWWVVLGCGAAALVWRRAKGRKVDCHQGDPNTVRPLDVYQDLDARRHGRLVVVMHLTDDGEHAVCRTVNPLGFIDRTRDATTIQVARLLNPARFQACGRVGDGVQA